MSKKKWGSQFEDLFPNLDDESSPQPAQPEQNLAGWAWESDAQGAFTYCSPEVEAVLGFRPEEIIGQPLTRFGLPSKSARKLEATLKSDKLPAEVLVIYQSRTGEPVPVSLFIFSKITDQGSDQGFRGFAQRMAHKQDQLPIAVEASTPDNGHNSGDPAMRAREAMGRSGIANTEGKTGGNGDDQDRQGQLSRHEETIEGDPLRLASHKVIEILERCRENSELVTAFPESRIVIEEREEFIDDRTRPPIPHGSVAGRGVYTYHKILVQEVEHRLEWGVKLALSEEERQFIKDNQFSSPGLRGKLQRRMAPREILKCDLSWIVVTIRLEQHRARRVLVKSRHSEKKDIEIDLDRFLEDPKSTLVVENALKCPYKSYVSYHKGRDYLI